MFLAFSPEARARATELVTLDPRHKQTIERALRIAWDRLGPESEYSFHGRTMRRGHIEVRDIEAALTAEYPWEGP